MHLIFVTATRNNLTAGDQQLDMENLGEFVDAILKKMPYQ